jgi:hypothetical protein
MTVYGILPKPDANLSLSYTIDDGNATTISRSRVDSARDELNYAMIQTGPLVAGNHTIVVTLANIITNQKFIVDYITYAPSFPNLAAMPDLSNLSSESWSNSPSRSNSSSKNSSAPAPSSSSSNHVNAIAGGVIGGFACLVVIVIAVLCFIRRRRPLENESARIDPYLRQTSIIMYSSRY